MPQLMSDFGTEDTVQRNEHSSKTRQTPPNIGGPSHPPTDYVAPDRERDLWGLGAVLPGVNTRKAVEGVENFADNTSLRPSTQDRQGNHVHIESPSSPYREERTNPSGAHGDTGHESDSGGDPAPSTHPDAGDRLHKPKESEQATHHTSEEQEKEHGYLAEPRRLRSRQGSNAATSTTVPGDQGQLGGELAEDREGWDSRERDMVDNVHVRNTWGRVRFVLREPLAEFLGQVMGAFVGAFIIYGNYMKALHEYDPDKLLVAPNGGNASASAFITIPNSQTSGTGIGFGQEVLATAVLTIVVLSLGDENNAPPGAGLGAVVIGFAITAIGMSLGWQTGYAINPARDFGPRMALWILGYGKQVWTHNHWWWIIGPICGPLVGSLAGGLMYDLCIFTGDGSIVNYTREELAKTIAFHNMVPKSFRVKVANTESAAEEGLGNDKVKNERAGMEFGASTDGNDHGVEKWRWVMAKKGGKIRRKKGDKVSARVERAT
ncbi:hypothetical protein P7C70_g1160, partial [Phenoliferia sp. Uapishka_3]